MILKTIQVNKNWEIEIYQGRGLFEGFSGFVTSDFHCDHFIKYDSNKKNALVAYDFPERVPKYIKEKVRKELNSLITK